MRITTYKKGGNSLNPLIRLSIFLMIILCLFVMPVSAFVDDFDDKEIISDWNIITGTWSVLNTTSISGADDYYAYNVNSVTGSTNEMYRSVSGDYSYYEIDMKAYASLNLGGASKESFVFSSNGVTNHSINLQVNYPTGAGTYALISGDGFTYSTVSLTSPVAIGYLTTDWYHIEITTTTNNIKVEIFDINNNLIDSQTNAYTPLDDSNRIILKNSYTSVGNANGYFDNILLSSVSPSTVSGINWDLDQYIEGDTASYTWSLQNSFWWDLIYKYRIQILKNGVEVDTVSVSQTGNGYHDVSTAGVYMVKLQYSGLIITNWIDIDTDSVNVIPVVDSYINVPQTEYTGNSFEISYLYGRTPILPFLKVSKRQIDNTYVDTDWINLIDYGIIAGTTYTPNLTIYESGTYLIGIYDVDLVSDDNSLLVASDTIRIFYQDAIEQIIITKSKIDTNNISIIGLGDTLTGNYQVDSINYTNTSVRLEIYNYENDIISFSIPRQKQKGTYQAPLSNQEYFNEYIDGVNTVYKVDSLFYTGNNQVRLAGYNSDGTYNQTIIFVNVTIDYVNSAGYSLILSKYSVVQSEEFLISVICPTESTLNIWNNEGMHIKEFVISGNKDIKFSLPDIDKYYFSLQDPSGNLQASQQLTVLEGITEEIVIDEGTTMQDNTNALLNSPYLIGLLIMAVFLAVGAASGIGGMIVTGSMGLGIVCYMGIFPWILLVIEVFVVAILLAKGAINLSGE